MNLTDTIVQIARDGADRARSLTVEQREALDRLAMESFKAETAEQWADICRREAAILQWASDVTAVQSRYRRPPGECAYCDAHRNDSMMPSHTASARCESGKHAHCTCDVCF